MKKQNSKAIGGLNGADEKAQLGTPSSNVGGTTKESQPISDTSGNTASPKSQIGFRPTEGLEIDETTASVQVIMAFSAKLGKLAEWRLIELGDGQKVYALCFPLGVWEVTPSGALGVKTGVK